MAKGHDPNSPVRQQTDEAHHARHQVGSRRRPDVTSHTHGPEVHRTTPPRPLRHAEAQPVTCVDTALVESTLPLLTKVVADMIRFQLATGCRPGEVCKIKPCMVDRTGDVWQIELEEHKTAYRGRQRTIFVGPKAKAILAPYLLRAADKHCFSPKESEAQRLEARNAARKTPISCGNKRGSNVARKPRKKPGEFYTTDSYAQAIKYACNRGELQEWSPNQLRHTAATDIRKRFGLEAAQVILGHAAADVTQVYAERDAAKAREVVKQIG